MSARGEAVRVLVRALVLAAFAFAAGYAFGLRSNTELLREATTTLEEGRIQLQRSTATMNRQDGTVRHLNAALTDCRAVLGVTIRRTEELSQAADRARDAARMSEP